MAEQTQGASKKTNFIWTDEETALLVQVVIDYKTSQAVDGKDWETIKNKYKEITEKFQNRYPKRDSGVDQTQYPHCDDPAVFNKERISTKLKRIKTNFRKAVDSGRKSGGGRIVLGLYDECYEIWAGSPDVESVPGGIESTALEENISQISEQTSDTTSDTLNRSISPFAEADDEENSDEENENTSQRSTVKDMGEFRRNLIKHLQQKKDSKLTKRNAAEAQLLDTAKQEVALKKRGMDMMEESEKNHEKSMKKFEESINNLTAVISNGFNMLQGMFQQQTPFGMGMVPQHQQFHRYHQSNVYNPELMNVNGNEEHVQVGQQFRGFNANDF